MEKGKPFFILFTAIVILLVLSLFSWESYTKGMVKSFDLFSDLNDNSWNERNVSGVTYIDPDLLILSENIQESEQNLSSEEKKVVMQENIKEEIYTHETDDKDKDLEPQHPQTEEPIDMSQNIEEEQSAKNEIKVENVVNRDSVVPIEDYSADGRGLERLRKSFEKASEKLIRIAVVGDSYIEGDIFTESVREGLQNRYGGKGVGYVPLYSEIPGFRRSVVQRCSNWNVIDFRNKKNYSYSFLPGLLSETEPGFTTVYTGSKKVSHADRWDNTKLLFVPLKGGSLKISLERNNSERTETHEVTSADTVAFIKVNNQSDYISVKGNGEGMIFLGAYLDGETGVALDNMSIRGYSGIRHDEINADITSQSRKWIDYDLIILEFGINALSSAQKDYSLYGKKMEKVVNHLKQIYPNAQILIMGIGDRGEKQGTEIHSMSTIRYMIDTQRNVAKSTGSLFWDTRQAMGGNDAVVEWSRKNDINKDYIHLSFKGGKRLADIFLKSWDAALR